MAGIRHSLCSAAPSLNAKLSDRYSSLNISIIVLEIISPYLLSTELSVLPFYVPRHGSSR
jgi:hypothetical protein